MDYLSRFGCGAALFLTVCGAVVAQTSDPLSELLQAHQFDLSTSGQGFLLAEAGAASFVAVGGLHGDRETPALVQALSDGAQKFGYHDIAVEMTSSPSSQPPRV